MKSNNDYPWRAHKEGGRFCNLNHSASSPDWKEVARWKFGWGPAEPKPVCVSCQAHEPRIVTPDFSAILRPSPERIVATWVGHSTFLLQMGGINILTDPHFGSYCAPVPMPRFRRRTPPGLYADQLPRIDVILLSHSHYDHLDLSSLRATASGVEVYCPSGVGRLLAGIGANRVVEMSWGESTEFRGARLVCLPTQHGSARTPFDRNRSLWCGWMIERGERRAIFVGDTGYSPVFQEIGAHFGSIDLAMIPIGAYRPEWFMQPVHVNPMEAVRLHRDLRAKRSVAMHWGTFCLADEPLGEPSFLLEKTRREAGMEAEEFGVLGLGETMVV